ncbi:VOC family protein [Paenibacillus sp. YAF4_2]|uniref:VOC family protein n=1 Tax=Paenibacillus sp. YAF4_2 TaxID=3233085 RepID=UPI003F97CEC4
MPQEIWINLPVKDVQSSTAFFNQIGFQADSVGNERAKLSIGSTTILLFPNETFEKFTGAKIADTSQCAEVIFSLGANSKEEVDEIVRKVELAGGTIFGKPQESQGWMYGAGFADLDGHRWNLLYMDESKMPRG